jgi:6-phosphogluconolactonase (cycloisomerase 2 family)
MKAPLSKVMIIGGLATLAAGLEAQSKFVYTNNDLATGNSVSAFLDTNGALTEIANSPFSTGGTGANGGMIAAARIVVAGGKFLYASNDGSQTIAAFAIDANTGALTTVATSPYADGASATSGDISLAPSVDGQYLFAGVSANKTIVSFKINTDGSLTQVASTASPATPIGMKVTADGQYLAAGLLQHRWHRAVQHQQWRAHAREWCAIHQQRRQRCGYQLRRGHGVRRRAFGHG